MVSGRDEARRISGSLLDPRVIDPRQELVTHNDLSEDELQQVVAVLTAIRDWREAEQRLNFESRTHMKLNETDMKALRYIIASMNQGVEVTAGALAEHLHVSTASTTKLLDRLERAGHIERHPHPTDRRVITIAITDATHEEVRRTVGRQHARRFDVAKRLKPEERDVVIRFLTELSAISQTETSAMPERRAEAPGTTKHQ